MHRRQIRRQISLGYGGNAASSYDATAWGFWRTAWMVLADDVDAAPEARPAEHPRRFEALLLRVHAADKSAIELAPIERHEHAPPTLGEWKILEEGEPLP